MLTAPLAWPWPTSPFSSAAFPKLFGGSWWSRWYRACSSSLVLDAFIVIGKKVFVFARPLRVAALTILGHFFFISRDLRCVGGGIGARLGLFDVAEKAGDGEFLLSCVCAFLNYATLFFASCRYIQARPLLLSSRKGPPGRSAGSGSPPFRLRRRCQLRRYAKLKAHSSSLSRSFVRVTGLSWVTEFCHLSALALVIANPLPGCWISAARCLPAFGLPCAALALSSRGARANLSNFRSLGISRRRDVIARLRAVSSLQTRIAEMQESAICRPSTRIRTVGGGRVPRRRRNIFPST